MDQVSLNQKIECSINGRRRSFVPVQLELIENLVCANRFMTVPDQFKNTLSLGSESETLLPAESLGPKYRCRYATIMIVICSGKSIDSGNIVHRDAHLSCKGTVIVPCRGLEHGQYSVQ